MLLIIIFYYVMYLFSIQFITTARDTSNNLKCIYKLRNNCENCENCAHELCIITLYRPSHFGKLYSSIHRLMVYTINFN